MYPIWFVYITTTIMDRSLPLPTVLVTVMCVNRITIIADDISKSCHNENLLKPDFYSNIRRKARTRCVFGIHFVI